MGTSIVWFRRDARLRDNPAWAAGLDASQVCPVFVTDPLFESVSARRRQLLVAGLTDLDRSLQILGGRLMVLYGNPIEVLPRLVERIGAEQVHANSDVTPFGVSRDRRLSDMVELELWDGNYVHPPGSILTTDDETYRVFTPFYRSWQQRAVAEIKSEGNARVMDDVGAGLNESTDLADAGETAATRRLDEFLQHVDHYTEQRDRPDLDQTSRLSIDLKYGWIGPRTVLAGVGERSDGRLAFARQLAWRDFYAHIMARWPESVDRPMRREYENIDWRNNPDELDAWKSGMTGFPIVDAGMRQLQARGWIHNRVRMLIGSFLVKDLLVDWKIGERFLRHALLDGDTAQNVGNWQWVAGVGTDAVPYFRVFNPVTQSRKFDPEGDYIKRWVPELGRLPSPVVHSPWTFSPEELAAHGVVLGETYPEPIVDHASARIRAIDAYEAARSA